MRGCADWSAPLLLANGSSVSRMIRETNWNWNRLSKNETVKRLNEPLHDKTNKMSVHPVKTRISLGIRQFWSESLLCAQWIAKDPRFLHADSEDSDQTGRMPRLICVFAGHTAILLVLSCRGSNNNHSPVPYILQTYVSIRQSACMSSNHLKSGLLQIQRTYKVWMIKIWVATWQNQHSECAPSEDSDQPGHPPSLIRVFAVRMKKA